MILFLRTKLYKVMVWAVQSNTNQINNKNLHRECLNPRADIVKLEEIVAGVKATQEKVKQEYEETIAAERWGACAIENLRDTFQVAVLKRWTIDDDIR
jgi:transcriptional regulator NrdR family protein